jgi:LacI family transcriptional regulator
MSATMSDIAKMCGVSLTTVARALKNKGEISQSTKERILRIAREMDYAANVPARILAGGKSNIIGLVVADNSNPYYAKLIRGVEDTAKQNGYGVILYNTDETMDLELSAHQMLIENHVDGLLITSLISGRKPLENLQKRNIPYVLLNRYIEGFEADSIRSENRLGAYLVTSHLCKNGHKRIVHITGNEIISSVRERIDGYKQALSENGIAFDPNLILQCDLKLMGGYMCAAQAIEHILPSPTAIFAYSDLIATGVLKALNEKGIKVPDRMAVAGYDNIEFSPFLEPSLTTVDQFAYKIGEYGMQILLEKMNLEMGEERESKEMIIKPELIIRHSSK